MPSVLPPPTSPSHYPPPITPSHCPPPTTPSHCPPPTTPHTVLHPPRPQTILHPPRPPLSTTHHAHTLSSTHHALQASCRHTVFQTPSSYFSLTLLSRTTLHKLHSHTAFTVLQAPRLTMLPSTQLTTTPHYSPGFLQLLPHTLVQIPSLQSHYPSTSSIHPTLTLPPTTPHYPPRPHLPTTTSQCPSDSPTPLTLPSKPSQFSAAPPPPTSTPLPIFTYLYPRHTFNYLYPLPGPTLKYLCFSLPSTPRRDLHQRIVKTNMFATNQCSHE
nr:mucin-2-like [Procambarus clarkii]